MNEKELKLVGNIEDLADAPGNFISGATKKVVFGPEHFWQDYTMRCWTLPPLGGEKCQHKHGWCHWAVLLSGEGVFVIDSKEYPIKAGSYIHVPEFVPHRFYNTSKTENLLLLCIVPPRGDVDPTLLSGC